MCCLEEIRNKVLWVHIRNTYSLARSKRKLGSLFLYRVGDKINIRFARVCQIPQQQRDHPLLWTSVHAKIVLRQRCCLDALAHPNYVQYAFTINKKKNLITAKARVTLSHRMFALSAVTHIPRLHLKRFEIVPFSVIVHLGF